MEFRQPSTFERLLSAPAKARERGWSWLMRRLADEIRAPGTVPGQYLRRLTGPLVSLVQAPVRLPMLAMAHEFDRTLMFFYDLDVCPISFDIVDYLAQAELERRRRGLDHVHVVVVPGRSGGLRDEEPESEAAIDRDARIWRLHNLVIPVFALLPSLSGYTHAASRAQAAMLRLRARHIEPRGYRPSLPVPPFRRKVFDAARNGEAVQFIVPPRQALRYVNDWLEPRARGRKVVTVTLRDYKFMPARNSNREAWLRFARGLDPNEYFVVIIPDTGSAFDLPASDVDGLTTFSEVALSIWLRAALYELAYANMALMQGPTELAWYNARCRYVYFVSYNTTPQSSESHYRENGYTIGGPLPMAGRLQRLVWEPESCERITKEFSVLCADIEQADAMRRTS